MTIRLGYALSSEEHSHAALIGKAVLAAAMFSVITVIA